MSLWRAWTVPHAMCGVTMIRFAQGARGIEQWVIARRRLDREDVEQRAAELARGERFQERSFIDQSRRGWC